jgi:hypothetical protein
VFFIWDRTDSQCTHQAAKEARLLNLAGAAPC